MQRSRSMTSSGRCEPPMTTRRRSMPGTMRVALAAGAACWLALGGAWAAETTDPVEMSKTVVVLKLDTIEPLTIRSRSQEHPPVVTIEFPGRRVTGTLPERSVIHKGVIQAIFTRYDEDRPSGRASMRTIRSIQIALSEPYVHRVRSEAGKIIVEVDHPARVGVTSMEVGLVGGRILSRLSPPRVSERFQAMQEALAQAAPRRWAWQMTAVFQPGVPLSAQPATAHGRFPTSTTQGPERTPRASARSTQPGALPVPRWAGWVLWGLVLGLTLGIGWGIAQGAGIAPAWGMRASAGRSAGVPSGIKLIDQLVWRAFEQQGYQLVREGEIPRPPGILHVMTKGGVHAALLCIGNGVFFEKQTVEEFIAAMRQAQATEGFLVGPGAFTVPAQRLAREHQISLVGREQLVDLVTTGANSEHASRELETLRQQTAGLEGVVRRISEELETMRRQRNEASWYLGEERALSASLAGKLQALEEELKLVRAASEDWQRQAGTLRRQWEESEWYLGESRARARHLEEQLADRQQENKQLIDVQQQHHEATWSLEEERAKRQALNEELAHLQDAWNGLTARQRALQEACEWLKQEVRAIRVFGERRRVFRNRVQGGTAEYVAGEAQVAMGSGRIRDVSSSGLGMETEKEVPPLSPIRIRLSLPDMPDAVEAEAELMWQRPVGELPAFQSGYRFRALAEDARARIEHALEST